MTDSTHHAEQFFDRYAAALLARDEQAVAAMYAVPALILFPGNAVPVSDAAQTEAFFASSWPQYEGVDTAEPTVRLMGEAPGTLWADVTWHYDGQARERFCYQLVQGGNGYQIAVLTPMALPGEG
jgi:ketosteroid isomerase-like protein